MSHLVFVVVVIEWVVWPILVTFMRDTPKCPICKSEFQWREIDVYNDRGQKEARRTSFPCPKCQQVIGVPNWRKSSLRIAYFSLFTVFLVVIFQGPGDLFWGYIGVLLASVGAVRILDWFIWRRLEPGSPSDFASLGT
jgi:endogenous inhibitor of DNA gyrase (YacG/DUF329 family)